MTHFVQAMTNTSTPDIYKTRAVYPRNNSLKVLPLPLEQFLEVDNRLLEALAQRDSRFPAES